MRIKPGVNINGLKPELLVGLVILDSMIKGGITITCGVEGQHMRGSLHYAGMAADIRTPMYPADSPLLLAREALGPQFDLVVETDHWHLEYQPKEPTR